jgi:hypothetical protein
MIFGKFYGKLVIKRTLHEVEELKIWSFIVGDMISIGKLFIRGYCGEHKKYILIFCKGRKKKNKCHVRYVHSYKGSFGSYHSSYQSERYEK